MCVPDIWKKNRERTSNPLIPELFLDNWTSTWLQRNKPRSSAEAVGSLNHRGMLTLSHRYTFCCMQTWINPCSWFMSFFSVAVIEIPQQSQLIDIKVFVYWSFREIKNLSRQSWQQIVVIETGAGFWIFTSLWQEQRREGSRKAYILSKPTPRGTSFSKVLPLNPSQTNPPTGGQVFKCTRPEGTFLTQTTTLVYNALLSLKIISKNPPVSHLLSEMHFIWCFC